MVVDYIMLVLYKSYFQLHINNNMEHIGYKSGCDIHVSRHLKKNWLKLEVKQLLS